MPESLPPLSVSVRDACRLLEQLLEDYRYCGSQGEEYSWRRCYAKTWNELTQVLFRAGTAMRSPNPNDGIAAIWLRVVTQMAQQVEHSANASEVGYDFLLHSQNYPFTWLVNIAEYLGRKTLLAEDRVTKRLSDIAKPSEARAQLDELRQIALEADNLYHDLQACKSATRQAKIQKEIDTQLSALLKKAGQAILSYLNDGNAVSDPKLDEVVIYANGLDYKQLHPEYVVGTLANLWLPKFWKGFPADYWKNAGELRDDLAVVIPLDVLADQISELAQRLTSLEKINRTGFLPYHVDLDMCQVVCHGLPYKVSGEQARMLQVLLASDGWTSMRAHDLKRPDRLFEKLPESIKRLIESTKRGYRIRPEFRHPMAK